MVLQLEFSYFMQIRVNSVNPTIVEDTDMGKQVLAATDHRPSPAFLAQTPLGEIPGKYTCGIIVGKCVLSRNTISEVVDFPKIAIYKYFKTSRFLSQLYGSLNRILPFFQLLLTLWAQFCIC